jgi:serine/threonine protein kinase
VALFGRTREAKGVGEIAGRHVFRLVRKFAEGGMGEIYEARLLGADGFEKTVAIKMIRESLSSDAEFIEMFIGEAKLVADLVHQHIVQIYHLGKTGSRYYMALEFVEGVNLHDFVRRHAERGVRVPIDLTAYILSRVCRGLEYAHRKRDREGNLLGVVHRDISPRNILISTEGSVKLTDFGSAKAKNLLKDLEGKVLFGKARYMSPEQARYGATDGRSDLFSLGIVGYEILSGEPLFGGDTTQHVLESVVSKEVVPLERKDPTVPPDLARIVGRALERDLDRRYADAGMMAYDLEHHIYHDRFGPTLVTLQGHLKEMFPELFHGK